MTEKFKPGDNILADKSSTAAEQHVVHDIYRLKQSDKSNTSPAESSFAKKLSALDEQAHEPGALLSGKPDMHLVGVFADNLMLEHRNEGAKFPHHRYIINPSGEVVGTQAIDEKTGKVQEVPGKKGGWQLCDEFRDGIFREKAGGSKEMLLRDGAKIVESVDGDTTKYPRPGKKGGETVYTIRDFTSELDTQNKKDTNTIGEDHARLLLAQENQNVENIAAMLERKQDIRISSFDTLKEDLKSGRWDGQSNDVTILARLDDQIKPIGEQLSESKQRAELLLITVENFDYQKLIAHGQKAEADQLALKMLENHSSQILKDLSPDVWRKLGQPDMHFSEGLEALKRVPQSDTGRPPAQILYTTSLEGKPPLSDVLDTKILAPNAFRLDALRAIDSDPTMIKIEQLAAALNHNLNDLSQLARDGASGTKGEDFVKFTRTKAVDIQNALKAIEPNLLNDAIQERDKMSAAIGQVSDITSQAELQKRIDALSGMIELANPNSKTRQDVDALTKFVSKRDFAPDDADKWIRQELPALAGSIAAASLAVAAVGMTMGAASPLALALASAGAGSTGWLVGGEAVKEGLYHLNSIKDSGIGSLTDRSRIGHYASTPEEKKDLIKQVLGPYVSQIGFDTTMAFATMGAVGLTKIGGRYIAEAMGTEGAGRILNAELLSSIAAEPNCKEFIVRSRQIEELASNNPACREFMNRWLKETATMAKFTLAQESVSAMVDHFGEVNPQLSTGIAIGLAIAHGHLNGKDFKIKNNGEIVTTAENIDHVAETLRKQGHEVEKLKNGDLRVRYEGEAPGIIRSTGAEGKWQKIEENFSPKAFQQLTDKFCVRAAGRTLAEGKPVYREPNEQRRPDHPQKDKVGQDLTQRDIDRAMNELDPGRHGNASLLARALTQKLKILFESSSCFDEPRAIKMIEENKKIGKRWAVEMNDDPPNGDDHMVVVEDYDPKTKRLTILDSAEQTTYEMDRTEFLRHWSQTKYTYIREYPKGNSEVKPIILNHEKDENP